MKAEFICDVCGGAFWREPCYVARSRRNGAAVVTCGRACVNRHYKAQQTGDKNPAWRGGPAKHCCVACGGRFTAKVAKVDARYCSLGCKGAALRGAATPGPNRRNAPLYRRVAGATVGQVVHHIDGNYTNNSPENLQVMSLAEHTRLHALERAARARQREAA